MQSTILCSCQQHHLAADLWIVIVFPKWLLDGIGEFLLHLLADPIFLFSPSIVFAEVVGNTEVVVRARHKSRTRICHFSSNVSFLFFSFFLVRRMKWLPEVSYTTNRAPKLNLFCLLYSLFFLSRTWSFFQKLLISCFACYYENMRPLFMDIKK